MVVRGSWKSKIFVDEVKQRIAFVVTSEILAEEAGRSVHSFGGLCPNVRRDEDIRQIPEFTLVRKWFNFGDIKPCGANLPGAER